MNEDAHGLSRALSQGDRVIMSSGATATARSSYPVGYTDEVDMLLDGEEVTDEAESLVLPNPDLHVVPSESERPTATKDNGGEVRGRSHRMED
jgi:hypothetical protein